MSLANLFYGWYIFRQADAVIDVQCVVLFDVSEDGFLVEIEKDGVLLYFEAVDFQEDVAFLIFCHCDILILLSMIWVIELSFVLFVSVLRPLFGVLFWLAYHDEAFFL